MPRWELPEGPFSHLAAVHGRLYALGSGSQGRERLMARIRTVKPEFWTDLKVVTLSPFARLLFMGMWNFADDCGHIEDEPLQLKLQILPNDAVDASGLVEELMDVGLVKRLTGCLEIVNFNRHQRIDHPSTCRFAEHSVKAPRGRTKSPEPSKTPRSGREGKGVERKGKKPSPPAEQDGFEEFWDSYPKRNGKKIGKSKTQTIWKSLTGEQRELARLGVIHYLNACEQELTIAKDPFRWLRDKAWEDWQEPAAANPARRNGRPETPYGAQSWGSSSEPEPSCEHGAPMCADCRRANLLRLRGMVEKVAEPV